MKGEFVDIYCNLMIEAIICCDLQYFWLVRREIVVIYNFDVIYNSLLGEVG